MQISIANQTNRAWDLWQTAFNKYQDSMKAAWQAEREAGWAAEREEQDMCFEKAQELKVQYCPDDEAEKFHQLTLIRMREAAVLREAGLKEAKRIFDAEVSAILEASETAK